MNSLRRLHFVLWYLRRPPWDSGIVPPEVEAFIRENRPATALDLGCGTGTSSLALARAGWTVTGVDFATGAIKNAKQKAKAAGLKANFYVGDVTRLHSSLFSVLYDLVLDIGCFHGLSPSGKTAYMEQLSRLLAPGGTWMIYGFLKAEGISGSGITESELAEIQKQFELVKRQDGMERRKKPSMWVWFRK